MAEVVNILSVNLSIADRDRQGNIRLGFNAQKIPHGPLGQKQTAEHGGLKDKVKFA